MQVSSLSIYPLKSSRGVHVESVEVDPWGLRGDRRWAAVDGDGEVITARTNDRLLHVIATDDGQHLMLSMNDQETVRVLPPVGGRLLEVKVSRMPRATDAGDDAAAWLSDVLGHAARLVWQGDVRARTVSPHHGGVAGDHLSLADAGPVLLTTTGSLDQLNAWIAERDPAAVVPMERFRPNIVIDGELEAFSEDGWSGIRIGDLEYRHAERCDRCVLTTIDPLTLIHGKEPIRTLAARRRWDGKTWFGVRLVPVGRGVVRVGDSVTVATA